MGEISIHLTMEQVLLLLTSISTLVTNLLEPFTDVYKRARNQLRLLYNVRKYLNTDAATKTLHIMILSILTYLCKDTERALDISQ